MDGDIAKCFDKINHDKLLDLIDHKRKVRDQSQAWLESGNIFEGIFELTQTGTPQGGTISPLLSSIALDGIKKKLDDWVETQRLLNRNGNLVSKRIFKRKFANFICYTDDFVIMNHDVAVIRKCE